MFRLVALLGALLAAAPALAAEPVSLGPRPFFLIDRMPEGPLKAKLESCKGMEMTPRDFVIGHRGAPLMFPEHTRESYLAAARTGAGALECDVTFTKDHKLVCRHAQDDLHRTTDILATPLREACVKPLRPAKETRKAVAKCQAADLTLEEFRTLRGKMDGADRSAETAEDYIAGTPVWRTDLYAAEAGTLMTHAESVALFKSLGVRFVPELKAPEVRMPHDGFSRDDYRAKIVAEYEAAGVAPQDVFLQSFDLDDVRWWIENRPLFGRQAVWLDGRYRKPGFDPMQPESWSPSMAELKEMGVNYLAPPIWMLLTLEDGEIAPSAYAKAAKKAGLELIAWSLERSGPMRDGGGWYHQTVRPAISSDAQVFEVLDVLAQEVGVAAVFSDWPATAAYYANCVGLD